MDTATLTIIIVIIFALIAIFSFVVYQKRGEAEIKVLGMSLKIKGSNEIPHSKPAISAKDIVSREGGLLADDGTGQGIEIEKVNVKDDVLLSSNNPPQNMNKRPVNVDQPVTLNAQMVSAGGNITIQQFVGGQASLAQELEFFIKSIGLEKIRENKFAKSQYEAYCNAWKSLQGLRVAGDDLWEIASQENVIVFAKRLREAKTIVREEEIFLEDKDREDLNKVLQEFMNFRLGKVELIEIRSKRDIEKYSYMSEEEIEREVSRQIQKNYKYKIQYEQLLEKIRVSFKRRLSSNIV
ncbi:MAG: hypothetical protein HY869_01130 [Chloroflexi bacterium]|nr:hypothetical protein [Chloroflexota bacterium]